MYSYIIMQGHEIVHQSGIPPSNNKKLIKPSSKFRWCLIMSFRIYSGWLKGSKMIRHSFFFGFPTNHSKCIPIFHDGLWKPQGGFRRGTWPQYFSFPLQPIKLTSTFFFFLSQYFRTWRKICLILKIEELSLGSEFPYISRARIL